MKSVTNLIFFIFSELIPIIIGKILLVFFWKNNILLTALYAIIILVSFKIKYEKREWAILLLGALVGLSIELWAVNVVGFQTFTGTAAGNIPLWMPLTWGYGFIVIKRISVAITNF
ncbi:MAG: hypothetical protein AABW88_02015 [Nanoarchaeota archaeon]